MEGYSNIVLYLILVFGSIFLFKQKVRIFGIILISLSLAFLFIIPTITFWKYQKDTVGTYSDKKGTEITIYSSGKYGIRFKGNTIGEGMVTYNKHDSYHFTLNGYAHLISTSECEIVNFNTGEILFYKVE
jgi:cell division protein FtsW (lipid II flippase)